ncbi:MAG: HD domain-containing protein [Lachnospiraceae bacterium]|nr:HD domain-containing protein [Lachnospiraceae bacterium]
MVGRLVSNALSLPLWLDSVGTVIMAYSYGPFSGALVGVTGNIMIGFNDTVSTIYALTSIAIAIVVGYAGRKGHLNELFGVFSISVLLTVVSVVVSVPVNYLFYEGSCNNIWGDGVYHYLMEQDVPPVVACTIGEFYMDFLDKLITMLILYFLIHLRRFYYKKTGRENEPEKEQVKAVAIFLATAAAFVCLSEPVMAEDDLDFYVETVYNQDEGLTCGTANDIAETGDGILWIGTYAGLYRYNGTEFRLMQQYESVRNVNCLYVDEEGRMWIGTNDNGLSICINEEIANVLDESSGLVSNSVRDIICCSDGKYYIGTSGAMQVVELRGGVKLLDTIDEVNYAYRLSADENGHVAAVTNDGQLFILKDQEVICSADTGHDQEIFTYCTFDENGVLYAATSAGRILNGSIEGDEIVWSKKVRMCSQRQAVNGILLEENRMIVCQDTGVGYFDANGRFVQLPSQGFDNSIDSMVKDYQGNYWFVSSRQGIMRLTHAMFTDYYRIAELEPRVVNAVVKWRNSLYIGTDTGMDIINLTTKKAETSQLQEELEGVRIRCVSTDEHDNLWISTYSKGLICVSPTDKVKYYNSSTDENFGDWARLTLTLSDGSVAATSDTGVCFLENGRLEAHIEQGDALGTSMVLCLLETSDGTVMAGTDGDGIALIRDRKVVRRLKREDGLSSGVILRLIESKRTGGIYIVTSNGLNYMDENGVIRQLSNFPYYNNYDIWQRGDGTLFVLSSAGIYVVNEDDLLSEEESLNTELMDATSGLDGSITANSWSYENDKNELFFCCDTGVYMLDMNNYVGDWNSYRMRVSAIELDGVYHQIFSGEETNVPSSTDKIEIFPEIINFTTQNPNVRYQLQGFDTKKTVIKQDELSSLTYTNLPAGEYDFVLEVLDDKGKTIEKSTCKIVMQKEIYDNPWFKVYMIVVGMLAVAWITWFVARKRLQDRLKLQQREIDLAKKQVEMGNVTILAIARAVDAKDERTSQHSFRVSEYSVMIAKKLGLPDEDCENLRKAALLHDIGKIGIPDSILKKPDRLTDEEYKIMKSHVEKGAEILKDLTFIDHLNDGVLYHHERYDGKGYTHGLKGKDIPLFGRIIGVADAFDAMTADRVYRKQLDFDFVLDQLHKGRGVQFDPEILDIFLALIEDGSIDVEALYGVKWDDKKTD